MECNSRKNCYKPASVFDIFDNNGNSYADTTVYEVTFVGTKSLVIDKVVEKMIQNLAFSSYRSISNVGDIVFNFDILQDSFTFTALKMKYLLKILILDS